ncbi:helix-turn-helix domain containing protein [Amylibacter marinus]|uniref:Helix-turn-helix domain containing protein n=1 Tax=Amylibacter marinus TaxID=1475483 RepID=A0ABQ5VSR0_9RHOB|nr:DUF6456 domain-containing protein [Amylibacter marinus]GLQ34463.1 helix-turn-helix domain containing protein [Amylibacter marinus]
MLVPICPGQHLEPSGITVDRPTAATSFNTLDLYLAHVHHGRSFRSLARETGLNPSTVLRRIRKVEDSRDDPLIDAIISNANPEKHDLSKPNKERSLMTNLSTSKNSSNTPSKEELRILRRLCENGAFLVIGQGLDKGAVLRAKNGEKPSRIAVVTVEIAKAMVMRDWIKLTKNASVSVYHVTEVGIQALRRSIDGADVSGTGFGEQHREWGTRDISDSYDAKPRKMRVNLRESPLTTLARKKDAEGNTFLSKDLLDAGERLREDFELAQLGPRVTQNWDRFINGGDRGSFSGQGESGNSAAQKRLQGALGALGAGLGDIALRCCCFLEGLESAEKRMGWSARSGKIVLRIALQRLRLYYDDLGQMNGDYIG